MAIFGSTSLCFYDLHSARCLQLGGAASCHPICGHSELPTFSDLKGYLVFGLLGFGAPRGIGRTATVSRQWLVGSVDAAVFGDAQW